MDDAAALALLGAATFLETYAEKVAGSDIVAHCRTRHTECVYEVWLRDAAVRIWIAQTSSGAAIAYLVLTKASLPGQDPHPADLEVQRLYVLSRYQRGGVGHRLMGEALSHAQASGARQVVLGMLKTNLTALVFYERQGFAIIGARQFKVGASLFDDHVLGRQVALTHSSPGVRTPGERAGT